MARQTLTETIARSMMAAHGIAIIWRLHTDAARLYRTGHPTAAAIFIEIADAAEEAWLRRETVAGE
jgi:hypothetical protein